MHMTYEERKEQWDREFGRISGIPPCCIDFYVKTWEPLAMMAVILKRDYNHANLNDAIGSATGFDWGYIACPGCRASGARVTVRRCKEPYPQPTP